MRIVFFLLRKSNSWITLCSKSCSSEMVSSICYLIGFNSFIKYQMKCQIHQADQAMFVCTDPKCLVKIACENCLKEMHLNHRQRCIPIGTFYQQVIDYEKRYDFQEKVKQLKLFASQGKHIKEEIQQNIERVYLRFINSLKCFKTILERQSSLFIKPTSNLQVSQLMLLMNELAYNKFIDSHKSCSSIYQQYISKLRQQSASLTLPELKLAKLNLNFSTLVEDPQKQFYLGGISINNLQEGCWDYYSKEAFICKGGKFVLGERQGQWQVLESYFNLPQYKFQHFLVSTGVYEKNMKQGFWEILEPKRPTKKRARSLHQILQPPKPLDLVSVERVGCGEYRDNLKHGYWVEVESYYGVNHIIDLLRKGGYDMGTRQGMWKVSLKIMDIDTLQVCCLDFEGGVYVNGKKQGLWHDVMIPEKEINHLIKINSEYINGRESISSAKSETEFYNYISVYQSQIIATDLYSTQQPIQRPSKILNQQCLLPASRSSLLFINSYEKQAVSGFTKNTKILQRVQSARSIGSSPNDWKTLPERIVIPLQPDLNLPTNRITTSKYNLFTFIPLNLYEQFSKMANLYFLVVGLLQMIPAISITNGLPTEYTALVVIVIMTGIKDLFEDLERQKQDKKENSQLVESQVGDIMSQDIRVGDVITIHSNQKIPADILLLGEEEGLVETSQLDGEINLKPKQPVKGSITKIQAESPNPYLYKFDGSINDTVPLSESNLILKGCTLKHPAIVQGVVIYTGDQTKIMLNQHRPRGKQTRMQKFMNRLILLIWLIQWIICFFCALMCVIADQGIPYLVSVGNWFLLFINFIPISLMLTLEMIRFFQAKLMQLDIPDLQVQSSNLNDDLGQITQIFSDKTGTLTKNKMHVKEVYLPNEFFSENDTIPENHPYKNLFFMTLGYTSDVKKMDDIYLSQSQDEVALFRYLERQNITIEVDQDRKILVGPGIEAKGQILQQIEFSSHRRRTTAFVKIDDRVYLFTKGAESVILERAVQNQPQLQAVHQASSLFSQRGLRSLVYGFRILTKREYSDFQEEYTRAKLKSANVDQCLNSIEVELTIIGVTGTEDELQDKLPETISILQQSQISIWIITGDHQGTAYSVARSIQLINSRDKPILVNEQSMVNLKLETEVKKFEEESQLPTGSQVEVCLLISGSVLNNLALDQKHELVKIARKCKGVVFCRVTPKQKREIVQLYQDCFPRSCTLAIGDGANDVNMITEANVGVGIQGVEGMQAARASDYSISSFKDLQRLLLFNGRECYRRNSYVVLYSFYKNVLYLIPQFWFGFHSSFTAQSIYDFYVFQCYNFMFTSLPIIIFGIFDIETEEMLPEYYFIGQQNGHINYWLFFVNLGEGVYQSVIVFYFTFYCANLVTQTDGYENGLQIQGQLVFLICVVIANFKVLAVSHQIPLLQIITQAVSFLSYLLTMLVANYLENYMLYLIITEMFSQPALYLLASVTIAASMSLQLAFQRFMLSKNKYRQLSDPRGSISLQEKTLNTLFLKESGF